MASEKKPAGAISRNSKGHLLRRKENIVALAKMAKAAHSEELKAASKNTRAKTKDTSSG